MSEAIESAGHLTMLEPNKAAPRFSSSMPLREALMPPGWSTASAVPAVHASSAAETSAMRSRSSVSSMASVDSSASGLNDMSTLLNGVVSVSQPSGRGYGQDRVGRSITVAALLLLLVLRDLSAASCCWELELGCASATTPWRAHRPCHARSQATGRRARITLPCAVIDEANIMPTIEECASSVWLCVVHLNQMEGRQREAWPLLTVNTVVH
jgi:hypothetical protein